MSKSKVNRPQWGSEHIRALRRHLGLTQRELADRLGTRQQTISEWELGLYKPRGASSTLLSMVAEQAKFEYKAVPTKKHCGKTNDKSAGSKRQPDQLIPAATRANPYLQ